MSDFISFYELDELGEALVLDHISEEGRNPETVRCVDIVGLANYLGLEVVYASFAEDDPDKIGFLSDGITSLMVNRNGMKQNVVFPKKTIVVERALLAEGKSGRCRFTTAHEVAHYILDIHHPTAVSRYNREYQPAREYQTDELSRLFSMVEAQADRLASVLLLPGFIVDRAMADQYTADKIPVFGDGVLRDKEKRAIQRMADQTGVSFTTMKYRLQHLRLFDNRPLQEYIREDLRRRCLNGGECE